MDYGIDEGRRASESFDVTLYKANYPDLQELFGDDNTKYVDHYLNYGINEGRCANRRILNGISVASDGKKYYYKNDQVDTSYTGFAAYQGNMYYVLGGIVSNYTGLINYYGTWYYLQSGSVKWDYTSLVEHSDGAWYYVEKGILNWNYNGLVEYYGTLYYIQNGYLNWGYSGRIWYNGKWYKIVKGVAQKD